ncbi:ParB N-terminal domain-containing protein [Kitasatospora sp. GP82]|uniref:ParB/RepB/Spo0J family partition protein n=1 Tax=Kitasatospora sp. GP82 TaxID=3035089 RepID=UPI0024772AEC|nr:ParB N-terminal domain-containing protein [Kitasatospora sp. GP82]MDH6128364.1 hypothetical protein [Kitasatospora sp. GP82]
MTRAADPTHTQEDPARRISLRRDQIRHAPAQTVPVGSLLHADSPRLNGEDAEHVAALADAEAPLPPILVHRPTMRVVDGMHRLRAAVLRGQEHIEVRFFDGDETEVFLLSVAANTGHGLPLSSADRAAAAHRIFSNHPEWSDRMVGSIVGLSSRKVAELRRDLGGQLAQLSSRIGRDGRSRPLDWSQGRERASEVIRSNPTASLRQIARAAGISPTTAADVRDRLRRGEDPVPLGQLEAKREADRAEAASAADRNAPRPRSLPELASVFDTLRRDPSLRFSETGRSVLRMFDVCRIAARQQHEIVEGVAPHCAVAAAEMASGLAGLLEAFATELRQPGEPEAVQPTGSRRLNGLNEPHRL